MKITSVEIFDCKVAKVDPSLLHFNPVLVRINTDEGISGIGEAGISFGTGSTGAIGMLRDLAPLVIGKDPMQVEGLWESMLSG